MKITFSQTSTEIRTVFVASPFGGIIDIPVGTETKTEEYSIDIDGLQSGEEVDIEFPEGVHIRASRVSDVTDLEGRLAEVEERVSELLEKPAENADLPGRVEDLEKYTDDLGEEIGDTDVKAQQALNTAKDAQNGVLELTGQVAELKVSVAAETAPVNAEESDYINIAPVTGEA